MTTSADRSVEAREWRPIETAPKDGTEILLFELTATGPMYRSGYWEDDGTDLETGDDASGWTPADSGYIGEIEPTHWMPLPDPPGPATGKAPSLVEGDEVERVARAICQSGKFETGEGTCALLCLDTLGSARDGPHGCPHAARIHRDLARAAISARSAPPEDRVREGLIP